MVRNVRLGASEAPASAQRVTRPEANGYAQLLRVLREVAPGGGGGGAHWRGAGAVEVRRVTGGVTNRIYLCTSRVSNGDYDYDYDDDDGDDEEDSARRRRRQREQRQSQSRPRQQQTVLVRVFGAEGLLDRATENAVFAELAAADIGPPLIGVFANGRVEGALRGETLDYGRVREARIAAHIARELARLHAFEPSCAAKPLSGAGAETVAAGVSELWAVCRKMMHKARAAGTVGDARACDRLEAELNELRRRLPASPLVYCHNDLLAANILYDEAATTDDERGRGVRASRRPRPIRFVDFEYACWNHRAYDIGNHWNEWLGVTETCAMEEGAGAALYPTRAQRRAFARAYLDEARRAADAGAELDARLRSAACDEARVDALVREADAYSLLSHWLWGVWAFAMAAMPPTDEFDYIKFGELRLTEMRRCWGERLR